MAKDQIEGAARIAKGSIKEAIGKIAGSPTTEAQGAAEQASGRAQEAADKGKDARRHPGKKSRDAAESKTDPVAD